MSTQTIQGSSPTETESTPEAPPEATELPLDEVFGVLSNERRRRVLRYLLVESESTTLGDLAEHIASIENDKPVKALSSSERKRVYVCLYQCHLPKMGDAGIIDFDEHRKTVEPGENIDQVTEYLPAEFDPGSANERGTTTLAESLKTVGRRLLNLRTSALD